MSTPIQRRIEALEVVNKPKRRIGLIGALDGETTEQTLARLGLPNDEDHRWIVIVPMKRERTELEAQR